MPREGEGDRGPGSRDDEEGQDEPDAAAEEHQPQEAQEEARAAAEEAEWNRLFNEQLNIYYEQQARYWDLQQEYRDHAEYCQRQAPFWGVVVD